MKTGAQGNRQDLVSGKCRDARYMLHGALGPRFRGDDNGGSGDDNGVSGGDKEKGLQMERHKKRTPPAFASAKGLRDPLLKSQPTRDSLKLMGKPHSHIEYTGLYSHTNSLIRSKNPWCL